MCAALPTITRSTQGHPQWATRGGPWAINAAHSARPCDAPVVHLVPPHRRVRSSGRQSFAFVRLCSCRLDRGSFRSCAKTLRRFVRSAQPRRCAHPQRNAHAGARTHARTHARACALAGQEVRAWLAGVVFPVLECRVQLARRQNIRHIRMHKGARVSDHELACIIDACIRVLM